MPTRYEHDGVRAVVCYSFADPDPAFHFNADPDPVLHFDADPVSDPGSVIYCTDPNPVSSIDKEIF